MSNQMSKTDEADGCSLPTHVSKCPTLEDDIAPCTLDRKRKGTEKACRTESELYHNDSFCRYSAGEECIEWQARFALGVGIPGINAFKRLPEWLQRPRDVNGNQMSRWMKSQHLIYDLKCVYTDG
jgi:hypothetical protein